MLLLKTNIISLSLCSLMLMDELEVSPYEAIYALLSRLNIMNTVLLHQDLIVFD